MKTLLDSDLKSKIRRGEEIEECGLTFYPIKMIHYEEFLNYRNALSFRMSTLPSRYISMDYLSALFALSRDFSILSGKYDTGMYFKVLKLFFMALRIDMNTDLLKKCISYNEIGGSLVINKIRIVQNKKTAELSSRDFSDKIRPLLAMQNGIVLPNEDENADIYKSYEDKTALNQNKNRLNFDTDDLISSVAYLSNISEKEINQWTVREFENRRRAIERDKQYMLCSQAEMSGFVSFKNGNPAPSWCFEMIEDSLGTQSISEIGSALSGAKQGGELPQIK